MCCSGLLACDSDDPPDDGSGGSAGSSGTSGSSGKAGGAGSTSGGGGSGGRAGSTGGAAGKASGGSTSGVSGSAGTDGSGGERWDAACNGVSNNGRCTGNVYEWCDYFSGSVIQLDCTPLGMTCRAESQPNEPETNGCVGQACTSAGEHCDGQLRYDCQAGEQVVIDCKKPRGPASECEIFEGSIRCAMNHPCAAPSTSWCEGNLHVICTEDSVLYYQDCQRKSDAGRCVAGANGANCDTSLL
jgi:hypothetical protein